jgi:tetratricopeptide (TPR) repeat protein
MPRSKLSILILIAICTFIVSLEMGLRGWSALVERRLNSAQKVMAGEYVILTLGESTTAGNNPDTWPSQLQKLLSERENGLRVRVINRAIYGTTTNVLVGNLESHIRQYKPNVIVSMMGVNDEYTDGETRSVYIPNNNHDALMVTRMARIVWQYFMIAGRSWYELYVSHDATALAEKGDRARIRGAYEIAEKYLLRSIAVAPDRAEIYVLLALLYRSESRNKEAENALLLARSIAPDASGVYVELGDFYRDNGNTQEAEVMYSRALELDPANALAFASFGILRSWYQGDDTAALVLYRKAIDLNPTLLSTYFELAEIYHETGDYKREKELYEEVLRRDPSNLQAKRQLVITDNVAGVSSESGRTIISTEMNAMTAASYQKLIALATQYGIPVVAVQYPLRSADILQNFIDTRVEKPHIPVTVVANEINFKDALSRETYDTLFTDQFGGNFGHATVKGNALIADGVARAISSIIHPPSKKE